MSMIPPRTAKSPGSVTVGDAEKPIRARKPRSPASSMRSPTRADQLAPATTSRAGRRCSAAFSVVSRTKGPRIAPCANAASVAMRVAWMAPAGDTRS